MKLKIQGYNHPKTNKRKDGKARTKKIKETNRTRKGTTNRATRTKGSTTETGTHPNNTETTTTIATTTTLTITLTTTHTTRTEDQEADKVTEKATAADDPPPYDPNKINNPPTQYHNNKFK